MKYEIWKYGNIRLKTESPEVGKRDSHNHDNTQTTRPLINPSTTMSLKRYAPPRHHPTTCGALWQSASHIPPTGLSQHRPPPTTNITETGVQRRGWSLIISKYQMIQSTNRTPTHHRPQPRQRQRQRHRDKSRDGADKAQRKDKGFRSIRNHTPNRQPTIHKRTERPAESVPLRLPVTGHYQLTLVLGMF